MAKRSEGLLPSPPIGYRVLWRECGGKNVKPADVVGVQQGEPGVLALSINLGSHLKFMDAVHWERHPGATDILSKNVQYRGTWAYMPGETVPDVHLDLHRELIEQTAKNRVAQEQWIEEQRRLNEEAQNQPVDPVAVAVAREAAAMILQGAQ